jgi:hypothetical protein
MQNQAPLHYSSAVSTYLLVNLCKGHWPRLVCEKNAALRGWILAGFEFEGLWNKKLQNQNSAFLLVGDTRLEAMMTHDIKVFVSLMRAAP